jgi:toxin CptA
LIPWLVIVASLTGATWFVAPWLTHVLTRMPDARLQQCAFSETWITRRQAQIAWALLTAALFVRLAGAVHPLFDARDIHVHTRWLETVASGQLFFYSTPAEFQNRQTFNPPAAYIVLLPLHLALGDMRLTVQAGVALLDGLIAPLLLLIARELGLAARAGLFAMALHVALPISMTMMWWGFAANAIAQTWWILLLWLLLRLTRMPDRSLFALFTMVAILCLTTHIGALVTLAAFLVLIILNGWRVLPRNRWRAMIAGFLLAGLLAAPLYFIAAAAPLGNASRSPTTLDLVASFTEGLASWPERVDLVQRALTLGFLPSILALAATGLPLLFTARERHPLQRTILLSLLAVCIVFFFSYVFLQLLTRYIYFATPFVCLAAGATIARLAVRPGGRWVAYSLTLFVVWSGVVLWFGGVLLRIKPSLVPLTQ